jgi:4-amino-4-deoxy-L-arabinose transferase-like glycosyltransferase
MQRMSSEFRERLSTIRAAYIFLAVVAVIIFLIRLTGPPDLMGKDQERPAAYVMDVLQNGEWLCQRDHLYDITSKPPMYTWLAASAAYAFGGLNLATLYLPSAASTLAIAWLILGVGRAQFGLMSGFFGALMYLLSFVSLKQIALARSDGVFALTVTIAAFLAYRAWTLQRGWTWFWIAAVMATLTKGPLGVLLAAGGLLAVVWQRRSGEPMPLKGSHWLGIALFVLVAGGWFVLSFLKFGQPLIDKMLKQEFLTQTISDERGAPMGKGFYKPSLYFLVRFAPWSLLACAGFWRVWRSPSTEANQRSFERFLFCWFFVGLFFFSCSPHQRGDLLWPLIPAAALLGGRELARFAARFETRKLIWSTVGVTFLILFLMAPFISWATSGTGKTIYVPETKGMIQLAALIREQVGRSFPLTHVDDPFALQFYLGAMRRVVSFQRAADLLDGDAAAFILVRDLAKLESCRQQNETKELYELARWPATDEPFVRIVSNHPRLEWTRSMAACWGRWRVHMEDARVIRASETEIVFESSTTGKGTVQITNESGDRQLIRMRLIDGGTELSNSAILAPGQPLRVPHQ